jgi:hypothetical protein
VLNTMTSGLYTVALNYLGDTNYSAATAATVSLQIGAITPAITWAQPAQITYGTTLSAILNAAAANGATPVAGIFAYTATPAGGSASTVTVTSVLSAGSYVLTALFTPSDAATYGSASATVSLIVGKAAPVLSWSAPMAITSGTALTSVLNPAATFNSSTVAGSFTFTATAAGGSAAAVTAATKLTAGSYSLIATFTPTDTANYASGGTTSVSLTVTLAVAAAQLASSMNPVLDTNPTALTATVTSSAGTPTGTVNFLDGTTPIGSAPLAAGIATLTLSSLAVGSHSISAVYGGDANFSTTTSGVLTQVVIDFTEAPAGGSSSSLTIAPGGSATYTLSIVPTAGATFPQPAIFTIAGMPPGATATISPATWTPLSATSWTFPANTALQNIALTIQLPSATAHNQERRPFSRNLPSLLWGLLLLPLAGKMRKASRRLGKRSSLLFLAAVGCALTIGISGCASSNGFFAQALKTYTITETVTIGTLSHSTTVTLTVE